MPSSLKSSIMPSTSGESGQFNVTGSCTGTRKVRRRSRFRSATAALKLARAPSLETGLYNTKFAPLPNALRTFAGSASKLTVTAFLLAEDCRTPGKIRLASELSSKSTSTASNLLSSSFCRASSALLQRSLSTWNVPRTRLSTSAVASSLTISNASNFIWPVQWLE